MLLLQLIHTCLRFQCVECLRTYDVSCFHKHRYGINSPVQRLILAGRMNLRKRTFADCFPENVFLFSVAQLPPGLSQQCVGVLSFPLGLAVLILIIISMGSMASFRQTELTAGHAVMNAKACSGSQKHSTTGAYTHLK